MSRRLALLVLLVALPAAAADEGQPLSLAEATQRALAKNQTISIERDSFRIAAASLTRADGSYDPSFHLDARYRDHTDPVNSLLSGAPVGADAPHMKGAWGVASIGQLLPTGGQVSLSASGARDTTDNSLALLSPAYSSSIGLDLRQPLLQNLRIDSARRTIRIGRIERDRSAASLRRTVADTITNVEKAYWTLVEAIRDVAVRRQNVGLADEQRQDTKTKIDVGTLPESDIAQPVAELERRKGDLYAAEEALRRADHQLKALILDDASDPLWNVPFLPTDSPDIAIKPVDVASALATAGTRRPEIADASLVVQRREVEIESAKDRVLPQLDLVASYARRGLAGTRSPQPPPLGFPDVPAPEALNGGWGRSLGTIPENRFPDASVGLSLTVPIGNRTAKADLVIANAGHSQAATTLAQQKQLVMVEVRNAAVALQTAAQRIEAARAGREAAETQLSAEKERFGVGLSTNFFVLTRQNDLAQAQVTESAALTDYRKALTDFARSVGTLLDERGIEIQDDAPATRADGGSR